MVVLHCVYTGERYFPVKNGVNYVPVKIQYNHITDDIIIDQSVWLFFYVYLEKRIFMFPLCICKNFGRVNHRFGRVKICFGRGGRVRARQMCGRVGRVSKILAHQHGFEVSRFRGFKVSRFRGLRTTLSSNYVGLRQDTSHPVLMFGPREPITTCLQL